MPAHTSLYSQTHTEVSRQILLTKPLNVLMVRIDQQLNSALQQWSDIHLTFMFL